MKDVCYIWEVDIENIGFINQLIKNERLEKISLLLIIDLSRVRDLWNVCESVAQLKTDSRTESKTDISFGIIGMKYDLYEVNFKSNEILLMSRKNLFYGFLTNRN